MTPLNSPRRGWRWWAKTPVMAGRLITSAVVRRWPAARVLQVPFIALGGLIGRAAWALGRRRRGLMTPAAAAALPLRSSLCSEAQLETETFRAWAERMGEPFRPHRKLWEWCYIAQALHERGFLRPGCRGLGFAVGQEPLVALFAAMGCEVVATDMDLEAAQGTGWIRSGQHSHSLESLNTRGVCDPDAFAERVTFRPVDMNAIPEDLRDFDFCWSACSLEHLGSIRKGEAFLTRMLECLRPGGLAVHTTEFNLSSDSVTLDDEGTVLFRQRDVERIAARACAAGHDVTLDLSDGGGVRDGFVDVPPYKRDHLRLLVSCFVSTSVGLIIRKRA